MTNRFFSRLRFLWVIPVFTVLGCKVPVPKPPLVETVAVLPFDNESNNVDAADIMQRMVYLAMKPSAYRVSDFRSVNDQLESAGISDGGQLAAVDPVKLGKDLGVQALMFGYVESFGYTNVGVYVAKKVNLELKLVDAQNGQTLWENTGKAATTKFGLDKDTISRNFMDGIKDQAVDAMFKIPLQEESKLATTRALNTLPGFHFTGFATDDQTPSGLRTGAAGTAKNLLKK